MEALDNAEGVKKTLERRFLMSNEIPRHWLPDLQHFDLLPLDLHDLLYTQLSKPYTSLELKTFGLTGQVTGYDQVLSATSSRLQKDAKSSTGLDRAPAEHSSFIRGKSTYFPFKPGGLPLKHELEDDNEDIVIRTERSFEEAFGGIQTIPPGFEHGLDFDDELGPILHDQHYNVLPIQKPQLTLGDRSTADVNGRRQETAPKLHPEVEGLLPTGDFLQFSTQAPIKKRPQISKRDWAHVVDVSKDLRNFHQLVPDMAKTYPFELDNFQKEAVYHMESGDSVFVAAHTSAGKTVVAEYAVALAIKHMTRAIYTSPIKALSNQKFRDFKETFGAENVGILTGDVQINPEAPCLIMTTEILRSMLYKGADLIRDIEWVIFDEVHYVNDLERGVVWEEVIIMLPAHVGIVMLSATVPNTKEFANWVGRTQQKDIYVISTPKRPVPLEHFLYASRDMFQVLSAEGEFQEKGVKNATEALRRKQDKEREAAGLPATSTRGNSRGSTRGRAGTSFAKGRGGMRTTQQQDRNLWIHLVGVLRTKKLLPVVIFTFSKKKCEEQAASMPNTDLCDSAEKSEIHIIVERSLVRLKGSDRKLPQILRMRDLLTRGIGIHHGGMLPIMKEMVEILFQRGLVKVLFATETFAMGVNMPARCVVFSSLRKHDGHSFRELLPGEYTQMSGRAGRRGLDPTGVVLIVCDGSIPDTASMHKVLLGSATKLTSQFRLTYNMILNLLRVEALRVQDMIRRSFSENASQRMLPEHEKQVNQLEKQLSLMKITEGIPESIRQYYTITMSCASLQSQIINLIAGSIASNKLLGFGRIVLVRDSTYRGNFAIIIRPVSPTYTTSGDFEKNYSVVVFSSDMLPFSYFPIWPLPEILLHHQFTASTVTTIPISSIVTITRHTMKFDQAALIDPTKRDQQLSEIVARMASIYDEQKNLLSQEADLSRLRDYAANDMLNLRAEKVQSLVHLGITVDETVLSWLENLHVEQQMKSEISRLQMAVSDENLDLSPDYQARIAVLQEMLFIDANNTVLLKGRVACEINSVNELILTELILENIFASFEPEEIVALLSALVFREKSDVEPYLTPNLQRGRDLLSQITGQVNSAQNRHRADSLGEGSNTELRFGLIEVVYEWARGMPFAQICELTETQEGTIIQAITRLDETCREVRDAARVIGDAALFQKMEVCREKIKRDIVFCTSLYI